MNVCSIFKKKYLFLFLCCIWNVPSIAATFLVDSLGDESDWTTTDNLCKTPSPFNTCTLRAAIEQANALAGPDTINFSVVGTINVGASSYFINDSVDIINSSASSLTINGQNITQIFSVNPSSTVPGIVFNIKELTLVNGYATGSGGANDATLTITRCTFSNNSASSSGGAIYTNGVTNTTISGSIFSNNTATTDGGAFYKNNGPATIINSTFSNNVALSGNGGAFYKSYSNVTVTNSIFSNNSASNTGGGIYNIGSSGILTIDKSTLSGNISNSGGGGIESAGGNIVITNSTLSNNSTGYSGSGGILNRFSATLKVTNSTISGNSSDFGGGIVNVGTLEMTNSTFSDNSATSSGGGLANFGTITFMRNTLIVNSLSGGDCYNSGTISENTNNFTSDGSCSTTLSGNPLLGPLQDNGGATKTHALLTGSPAIDAGNNATCVIPDQRGQSRPVDGNNDGTAICDIGAFEYQPSPIIIPPPKAKYDSTPVGPNGAIKLGKSIVGTPTKLFELTVKEIGDAPLVVNFQALTGPHSLDFKKTETSNPLSFTIPDNGTDQIITIECTPSAVGPRTAILELTSNDPDNLKIAYPLECIGESPGYSSTPLPDRVLNIGDVLLDSSIAKNLTVTENGYGDLVVDSPRISGANPNDFKVIAPIFPFTITDNSGQTKTIRVQCIPTAVGLRTATLTLKTNDPKKPNPTYPLQCNGVVLIAQYVSTPPPATPIDFGGSLLNTATPKRELKIENKGNLPLVVEPIIIRQVASDFSVINSPLSLTIPVGGTQTLALQCTPSAKGLHSATLLLGSNDPNTPPTYFSYPLTCTGQVAGYSSTLGIHSPLDFGSGSLNIPISRSFEISETGTADLSVDASITGVDRANFQLLGATSIVIPDGNPAVPVTMQCTPSREGLHSAELLLSTNDPAYPALTYPLSCVGENLFPLYDSGPKPNEMIPFGTTQLGTAIERRLSIINLGKRTLDVTGKIEGIHASDFLITPGNFPLSLLVGSNPYTLTIQCTPSDVGERTATLNLTTNDPKNAQVSYPLTCQGNSDDIVNRPVYTSVPTSGEPITFQLTASDMTHSIESILMINNQGQQDLIVDSVEGISGDRADNFKILSPHFPMVIKPQEHGNLTLQCQFPEENGLHIAQLQLVSNDPFVPYPSYLLVCSSEIAGAGYASFPLPNSSIEVGETVVLLDSLGQPTTTELTIIEVGSETLEILDSTIEGIDKDSFSIKEGLSPFSLPDGADPYPLTIQCTPKGIGEHFAQLILVTNDPRHPVVTYHLSCRGLPPSSDSPFPRDIELSNNRINRYIPIGTFIGQLTTIDSDNEDYHHYTLLDDAQGQLAIFGDGLYTATDLTTITVSTLTILVRSTNSTGHFFSREFTIHIDEIVPEIAVQIRTQMGAVGSHIITDNPERFTLLGYINPPVEHLEQPAKLTMMVHWTPSNGLMPLSIPVIRQTVLKPNLEINFFSGRLLGLEGLFEIDFGYQLNNGYSFSVPQLASLTVRPDQPPTDIFLSANTVSENSPPGTVMGLLSTVDPDKDEELIYSVIEDSGKHFMAVGNELQISYSFPLRFDERHEHQITIRSVDIAGNYIDKPFSIMVDRDN